MTADSARDLRAIQRKYPGWHLFASDTGHVYAVGPNCRALPAETQVTLHAPDAEAIGPVISQWEASAAKFLDRQARFAA